MMRTSSWIGLLALAGCETNVIHVGENPDDLIEVATIPTGINRDLDMLFVIDDSPSMLDKQAAMLASFPKMMDQLASLDGGLPDVHIGVVTSDLGARGTNGSVAPPIGGAVGGCSGAGKAGELQFENANTVLTGTYISDTADASNNRVKNYTGELRDVFTSIATVGGDGCGFEQTLGATKLALDPTNTVNAGFSRSDANLAIVILSDEDDCTIEDAPSFLSSDQTNLGPLQSFRCTRFGVTCDDGGATPDAMNTVGPKANCHANTTSPYVAGVQPMIDFVKGLKDDSAQIMVAAIVGNPEPVETELRVPDGAAVAVPSLAHSCQYDGTDSIPEVADPAVRIAQFVNAFGTRGTVSSVCSADLSLPMTDIGLRAKQLMGDPCIPVALAHPSSPTCVVTDGPSTVMPACSTGSHDCWKIVSDPVRCAQSPDQLRVEIDRTTLTTQLYAHVKCVIAP
jgi:hypothetical protein